MENRCRINYIFLLLSFGIISTIMSTPISAQTQNNSQDQTSEKGGSSPYTSGKPGIESANEMESLTNDTQTSTSNDTTPMMQELGEETQDWNQTAGDNKGTKQQEDNKGTKQQEDNKGTKQQEDNKGTKQQEDNKGTKQQEDNKGTSPKISSVKQERLWGTYSNNFFYILIS